MRAPTRLITFGAAAATAAGAFSLSLVPTTTPTASASLAHITVSAHPRPAAPVETAAVTRQTITVAAGQYLSLLAPRYGRTWQQLAGWNHLPDPNLVMPGQVLSVPPAGYMPPAITVPAPKPENIPAAIPAAAVTPAVPARAPVVTAAPAPAPAPAPEPAAAASGVWACIAHYESGGNPATNTGNGYYGMYQFDYQSWLSAGGGRYASRADLASAAEQTLVAERWQAMAGWGAWPVTSRKCGV